MTAPGYHLPLKKRFSSLVLIGYILAIRWSSRRHLEDLRQGRNRVKESHHVRRSRQESRLQVSLPYRVKCALPYLLYQLLAPPELATRAWRVMHHSYYSYRLSTILFSFLLYLSNKPLLSLLWSYLDRCRISSIIIDIALANSISILSWILFRLTLTRFACRFSTT